jgi:hypothetical protein
MNPAPDLTINGDRYFVEEYDAGWQWWNENRDEQQETYSPSRKLAVEDAVRHAFASQAHDGILNRAYKDYLQGPFSVGEKPLEFDEWKRECGQ